jgi:hypothetical protein
MNQAKGFCFCVRPTDELYEYLSTKHSNNANRAFNREARNREGRKLGSHGVRPETWGRREITIASFEKARS